MNSYSLMNEKQVKLLMDTIVKNDWCGADKDIQLEVWSNLTSPQVPKTYLLNDRSGYIRGYYDGKGIFYAMRFHIRDEEWVELQSSQFQSENA